MGGTITHDDPYEKLRRKADEQERIRHEALENSVWERQGPALVAAVKRMMKRNTKANREMVRNLIAAIEMLTAIHIKPHKCPHDDTFLHKGWHKVRKAGDPLDSVPMWSKPAKSEKAKAKRLLDAWNVIDPFGGKECGAQHDSEQ